MVLVVLLALALMALIISWKKQLPGPGERLSDLPLKRRALSIAAAPISFCVIVGFAVVAVGVAGAKNQPGYSNEVLVAFAGATAAGLAYLFFAALTRLIRAPEADAGDRER